MKIIVIFMQIEASLIAIFFKELYTQSSGLWQSYTHSKRVCK